MADQTIGLIVATPWEAEPLVRALGLRPVAPKRHGPLTQDGPFKRYEGAVKNSRILLVVSGMGQKRAREAALDLAQVHQGQSRLSLIISCGYGGALQPGLEPGFLAVDTDRSDPDWARTVQRTALRNHLRLVEGAFFSSDRILPTISEKKSAGAKTGALLVEMESRAVHEVCKKQQIPFGSIRAISDAVDQCLPKAALSLGPDGQFTFPFAVALIFRPQEWLDLIRLRSSSNKAAESLQKILFAYFNDPATRTIDS